MTHPAEENGNEFLEFLGYGNQSAPSVHESSLGQNNNASYNNDHDASSSSFLNESSISNLEESINESSRRRSQTKRERGNRHHHHQLRKATSSDGGLPSTSGHRQNSSSRSVATTTTSTTTTTTSTSRTSTKRSTSSTGPMSSSSHGHQRHGRSTSARSMNQSSSSSLQARHALRKKGAKSPSRRTVSSGTSSATASSPTSSPRRSTGTSTKSIAPRSTSNPRSSPKKNRGSSMTDTDTKSDPKSLRNLLGAPPVLSSSTTSVAQSVQTAPTYMGGGSGKNNRNSLRGGSSHHGHSGSASVAGSGHGNDHPLRGSLHGGSNHGVASVVATTQPPIRARNRRRRGSSMNGSLNHHGSMSNSSMNASEHSASLREEDETKLEDGEDFHDETSVAESDHLLHHNNNIEEAVAEGEEVDEDLEMLNSMIMNHPSSESSSAKGGKNNASRNSRSSRNSTGGGGGATKRASIIDSVRNMYSSFPGHSTRRQGSSSRMDKSHTDHTNDESSSSNNHYEEHALFHPRTAAMDMKDMEAVGLNRTSTVDLGLPLTSAPHGRTTANGHGNGSEPVRHSGDIKITQPSQSISSRIRSSWATLSTTIQNVSSRSNITTTTNNGNDDSEVGAAKTSNNHNHDNDIDNRGDNKRMLKLLCSVLIVLLGLGLVVILVLVNVDEEVHNSGGNVIPTQPQPAMVSETNSQAATPVDSLDISHIPPTSRYDAMKYIVQELGVSSPQQLDQNDSVQAQALAWMAQQDPAKLGIPNVDDSDKDPHGQVQALLQRYALMVLFLSETQETQGAISHRFTKWGTADSVCQWSGVTCNGNSLVQSLDLSSFLLQGTIPPELLSGAAFPALTHLNLSQNLLHGKLPSLLASPPAALGTFGFWSTS